MTPLSTFPLFSSLPLEVRYLIWEQTFNPRLIPLRFDRLTSAHDTYLHSSDLSRNLTNKPHELRKHIRITLSNFALPPPRVFALETCKESRAAGLKYGYRSWRMRDRTRRRDVMWNPALDTVFFPSREISFNPSYLTEVLYIQFPGEATQITRLAIPSTCWDVTKARQLRMVARWMKLRMLKEVVTVVHEEYERSIIMFSTNSHGLIETWRLPGDIQARLDQVMQERATGWNVESSRVVWNEAGILSGEDLKINLRCYPCEDLPTADYDF